MKLPIFLFRNNYIVYKNINRIMLQQFSNEWIVPLNGTTLIGRIVLFLNDYNRPLRNEPIKPRHEIFNLIADVTSNNIKRLNYKDIEELLYVIRDGNYISNRSHLKKLLRVIDSEWCAQITTMNVTDSLKLLSSFMQIVPNRITEYKSYSAVLHHIMNYIEYLTKEQLLQLIFYIGLQKKNKHAQFMVKKCIKHFQIEQMKQFSIEELCIICNTTFKTSTKITNKTFLEKVRSTINENLHLLKDPALFITLIKTIRHNRYQDENLLSTVSYAILFNRAFENYSFTALCHILALYADFLFYDDCLIKLFVNICIKKLNMPLIQHAYNVDHIRVKDMTRLLWVLSTLGYDLDGNVIKNVIVPKIMDSVNAGLYDNENIDELVNSVLYLWILNYQAIELLPYILTRQVVNHIKEIKSRAKERLNLLMTCMYYENKKLFKEYQIKAQTIQNFDLIPQLKQRPSLIRVFDALKMIASNIEVNKFELNFQIPHLNVCGITGYKKKMYKCVHIEVLDGYVCLKNRRNFLTGLMQLKMRILNELDEAVIRITEDEIIRMYDDELREHLKYEIEFVCCC